MSNEYLMDQYPIEQEPQKRGTYSDVIFGVIVILASAVSGYTTYLGFSFDIPVFMAIVIAILIGLGLLMINFKIRNAVKYSTGVVKPLIAFAFFFVFSFISNTNAIYTYFIERDIVGQTQEEAWKIFKSETHKVAADIRKDKSLTDFENRKTLLELARHNLKKQIVDELNPGLGRLAKKHLAEINIILGIELTPLKPPSTGASMMKFQIYAERLDDFIAAQAKTQFANEKSGAIDKLRNKIDTLNKFYGEKIQIKEYDSDTTDLMKRDLDAISVQARDLLPKDLKLMSIDNKSDATGSFQYTWANFLNWISPTAIILACLLGALLDLLAPVLSLLLYRPEEVY